MFEELNYNILTSGKKIIKLDEFSVLAFSILDRFRKSENLCDIRILCDTSEFAAHKVVLAASSPYFEAMFSGQFEESHQSTINMTDMKANIMADILDYFYTGAIELNNDNILALLQASNFLQVVPLFESCCTYILENINDGNCLGIHAVGKLLLCTRLREKAKDYAVIHFTSVCQGTEFLECDLESLIDIVGSDSLNVPCEELVFDAVIRWLRFKEEERSPVFPQVFKCVRLALLTPESLQNRVETEGAILKLPACIQHIQEAKSFLPDLESDAQPNLFRQRNGSSDNIAFLMLGEQLIDKSYIPALGKVWKLFAVSINGLVLRTLKQPKYFEYFCVSQCQSVLLAPHRDTIWRYNLNYDDWQPIAPLPKRRFSFGLGEVGGFWYAMGGFIPGSDYHTRIFNNVDRYQPSSDVWVPVAPIPEGVMRPAVVVLQGMIYVLGGEDKNGVQVDRVQRYDPRSNTWTQVPPFRVVGLGLRACALDQRIYLFYSENTSPIQMYSVLSNSWEDCAQSKYRFSSGPVVYDSHLYILSRGENDVKHIERYSPTTGSWEDVAFFSSFRPQAIFQPPRFGHPRQMNITEEYVMNRHEKEE